MDNDAKKKSLRCESNRIIRVEDHRLIGIEISASPREAFFRKKVFDKIVLTTTLCIDEEEK